MNDTFPGIKDVLDKLDKVIAIVASIHARTGGSSADIANVSYGPAPGKPVLVSEKWLEDLNNKLAQMVQRMNEMDGRTRQAEDQHRGWMDIITKQDARLQAVEKRATEHRRLIDAVDQSAEASRHWISRQLNKEESNAGG